MHEDDQQGIDELLQRIDMANAQRFIMLQKPLRFMRVFQLVYLAVLLWSTLMLLQTMASRTDKSVRTVADFMINAHPSEATDCQHKGKIIYKEDDFRTQDVMIMLALQIFSCCVIFYDMHKYRRGKSGSMLWDWPIKGACTKDLSPEFYSGRGAFFIAAL